MKAKIFFALVILAAFCCCSSDSTVESQGFGLTVNANGKMLSETYQKLDALLGSNSEDSLAVYKTRANLTTNSDFEELDDEQMEAKAKKVAHPTKSVAGLNQTPTIPDRKRTECPLPHAVGF